MNEKHENGVEKTDLRSNDIGKKKNYWKLCIMSWKSQTLRSPGGNSWCLKGTILIPDMSVQAILKKDMIRYIKGPHQKEMHRCFDEHA